LPTSTSAGLSIRFLSPVILNIGPTSTGPNSRLNATCCSSVGGRSLRKITTP
jgi:hypothetical protein